MLREHSKRLTSRCKKWNQILLYGLKNINICLSKGKINIDFPPNDSQTSPLLQFIIYCHTLYAEVDREEIEQSQITGASDEQSFPVIKSFLFFSLPTDGR